MANVLSSPVAELAAVDPESFTTPVDCLHPVTPADTKANQTKAFVATRKINALPSHHTSRRILSKLFRRPEAYKRRMASVPALPPEMQQALARGWTILTANQRAARTLRYAFDLEQRTVGLEHWQPPSILAWETWLDSLWRQLLLAGHATDLLLTPVQEHVIWREVIAADASVRSLRPVDALAETAASAWHLLHAYRARHRLRDYGGNSDTRVFLRWVAEFDRRCARGQYLTQAQLPEKLRDAVAAGKLTLPPGLYLAGFDKETPAQTQLLDAAGAAGCDLVRSTASSLADHREVIALPTESDELAACARWLRARLTENPGAQLAVIAPSLDTSRSQIERVFRQTLAPELNDITAAGHAAPFEFSLGVSLAHTPMVTAALDLLRWSAGPLPMERVSALLLSPYFAACDAAERLSRAEFDAFVLRWQRLLEPHLRIDQLERLVAQAPDRTALSALHQHLRTLRPLLLRKDQATAERPYADWAATMHQLLGAAGWALPATLDSIEFQTRRKWESVLDELSSLDFSNTRVSFSAAFAALERIAKQTLFAPESRHAPVQIMGPLESAGSRFDAIWFLRANDLAWPARLSANPLLPWPLQRDCAMPGADPAQDAAYASRISTRIAGSAVTVLFSYARESEAGKQRVSPALASLHLSERNPQDLAPAQPAGQPLELDTAVDILPAQPPQGHTFRGGSAVLQAQAACSFRAFAEKRLFASALDPVELGLDARDRGSLVHKVLEKFWAEVQTQATLRAMPVAVRNEILGRAIESALQRDTAKAEPGWGISYLNAERQRLLNLLCPWLDFEANERSPFVVEALEQTLKDVPIGPLLLDVRIDRIDTALVDGQPDGEIILDYKTSDNAPAKWAGTRPDEPQLPLYAIVSDPENLAGIAFAIVRPGRQLGLNGYESRPKVLPKGARLKTESLAAQVEQWKVVLEALAHEFHAGNASVSPKQYPSTCRTCDQRPLCRLNLATLEADANEDFVENPNAETSDAPGPAVIGG
jgi:ATP-dependent helicase/nuclease subunit B